MQVELLDIHKRFGAVHANAGISMSIPAGSIHGILGENGAGKSTLMKILSGFLRPESGTILLDGSPMVIHAPADAIRNGVGMLHQDPLDFPPMKLLDDFIVGRPGGLFSDRKDASARFRELAAQFDFVLSPESYVDTLTVGERQQLEILRLLSLGARVLILDEPTTGISLPQKEKLFATLKRLASEGMTVIFVSHKLEDVEFLCDHVSVLHQGTVTGTAAPPYETGHLVEMMFGKEISTGARNSTSRGDVVLSLQSVCLKDSRLQILDASLSVRAGEVIGLAGMEGSGQSTFLAACAGLVRPASGTVELGRKNVTGQSHHAFRKEGAAYLPAARLEQGLVPGLTLTEHFMLSEGLRGLFVNKSAALALSEERIGLFDIKGRPSSKVESLSGGNQQRMLLALLRSPLALILLEHPTRGLDIESTIYVWNRLKERCASGTSIVFISSDLDEILTYSDRVVVFFAGRVSTPFDAQALTVDQLGRLIGGKGWDELETERIRA